MIVYIREVNSQIETRQARRYREKKLSTTVRSTWASAICRNPFWGSFFLGVLGFLISCAGAWVPSPWLDEVATAHISSYPIDEMAVLWQHTDAVFAPYYVFMNVWLTFTGISPFWLRLPSLLAVGAGTAAMAAAGHAVGGPKKQVLYAACFALLPRVTAMGVEARPYALSAMFMAFALLAVVQLRRKNSVWYWLLLGLSMVGTVSAHFFSALGLVGLIAVALVLFPRKSRLALLVVSMMAGVACLPLAIAAIPQQSQVSWIADSTPNLVDQALVEAWFTTRWNVNPSGTEIPLHYIAVALAVLAGLTVAMAVTAGRPLPKDRLAIAAIPPTVAVGILWTISLVQEPMLLGRYLTSSAPFIAMLLAECLVLLRPHVKRLMASLLVVGCVLLIVAQRQPYAKLPANDYSFVASVVHNQARAGDGLLLEPGLGLTDSARGAMATYPQEFNRLVDIVQPQKAPLAFVFPADPPLADITQSVLPSRVWLVTKVQQESNYGDQLRSVGYEPKSSSSGPGHTVTLWTQP